MDKETTEAVLDTGTSEDIKKQIEAETSSGTLSDQGQTEGSTDITEEEPAKGKEEEWLLPGRFRKNEVDKLADAYRHVESYNSRLANEIYQLKQAMSESTKTSRRNLNEIDEEEFKRRALENPVDAINYIVDTKLSVKEKANQSIEFKSYYEKQMNNKEFAELEPIMVEMATQNMDLIESHGLKDNPRVLDLLYLAAKGVNVEKQKSEAINEGKKIGEKEAMKKVKLQVEGGSSSKSNNNIDPYKIPLDELRKRIEKGL